MPAEEPVPAQGLTRDEYLLVTLTALRADVRALHDKVDGHASNTALRMDRIDKDQATHLEADRRQFDEIGSHLSQLELEHGSDMASLRTAVSNSASEHVAEKTTQMQLRIATYLNRGTITGAIASAILAWLLTHLLPAATAIPPLINH